MDKSTGWERLCHELEEVVESQEDRIDELEATLAKGKQEWVSVEDEPPSDRQDCLVVADDIVNQWTDTATYWRHPDYVTDRGHGFWMQGCEAYLPTVTLWQPLPSPPSQKEQS